MVKNPSIFLSKKAALSGSAEQKRLTRHVRERLALPSAKREFAAERPGGGLCA